MRDTIFQQLAFVEGLVLGAPLRILHISDLHSRGDRESETWRRRRVLGEAWERNLDAISEDGQIDLVFFTGDAADWGLPNEFDAASEFFFTALEKLRVPRERFFVIPGNHDIRRDVETDAWKQMRAVFAAGNDTLDVARWASGGRAPFGAEADLLDRVLGRLQPYADWVTSSLAASGTGAAEGDARLSPGVGSGSGLPDPHHRTQYGVDVRR